MKPSSFRWNDWNLDHATKHGVSAAESERIICRNPARRIGDGKWMSVGRGQGDRFVQVIFALDRDGRTAYVIHAMPLSTRRRRH